jgi:glycosyltransferase involved in cell wall biosynthesis
MISINHVMSSSVESNIFNDIIDYFCAYAPPSLRHLRTIEPVAGAMLRHYHRPNLEKKLIGPCVVTVHHDPEDDDISLAVEVFLDRYREADRIICLNTLQQRYLSDAGIHHTVVIPHGYNDRFISQRRDVGDGRYASGLGSGANGRIVIGVVSRRYPRKVKGEGYIYELAQRLDPQRFEFVLIGRGRTHDAALLERYGWHVSAYESIPYRVLASVYGHIDVLLMASWHEGGPASIPEAVAAGVPVLCNPVGMAHDLILDELNGLHLSMDASLDADRIGAWLLDADRLRTLREGAALSVERAIPWWEHVARTNDVYRQVVHSTLGSF